MLKVISREYKVVLEHQMFANHGRPWFQPRGMTKTQYVYRSS